MSYLLNVLLLFGNACGAHQLLGHLDPDSALGHGLSSGIGGAASVGAGIFCPQAVDVEGHISKAE